MNSNEPFFFDPGSLTVCARSYAHEYRSAQPFPHIVIDGLFPDHVIEEILEEFPKHQDIQWTRLERGHQKKLISRGDDQLGPRTRHLINQLRATEFLSFLEELTGIEGVIPDPHDGGVHQVFRDGYLDIHVDSNWDQRMKLDRLLNMFIYLNKHWKEEYNGHLELWDSERSKCCKKILPIFNRMVLFRSTRTSYHGQPEPNLQKLEIPE